MSSTVVAFLVGILAGWIIKAKYDQTKK